MKQHIIAESGNSQESQTGNMYCIMSGFFCQGDPECREEKVTLIGEKPVEECQV